jgi:hypothetical protein
MGELGGNISLGGPVKRGLFGDLLSKQSVSNKLAGLYP